MSLLVKAFPITRQLRVPISRDQAMLLLAAFNELVLGIDTYLAHSITGTLVPGEWIPVVFGLCAGVILALAGLIALKYRQTANTLASVVFLASIAVGILGSYFHLQRTILPTAPSGDQLTLVLLVFGPPLFGPITFALVGGLGLSAAWEERPKGSGRLRLGKSAEIQMPLSKSRAFFLLTSLFTLATVVSSVFDHARTHFANPWLWAPTFIGALAVFVSLSMGAYDDIDRGDTRTYTLVMLLMGLVGLIGAYLHIRFNLIGQGTILGERFIHGAPVLAPLLFANMAILGLLVLWPDGLDEKA